MIGKTISHYRITEELGAGGMGVVYKAEDTKLNRPVALKFLPPELTRDPEAKARFIREAQAASALEHPNICNIHEIDETKPSLGETGEGQLFIVMACYEGETLKDKIKDERLKIKEAIDIAGQITEGLQKAHEKEILHRDIKPANIFITHDGLVKILDFGLAKLSGRSILTKDHSTLGTVSYMSPEQVRGKTVDHRSDIWSLGVLMYEMISGHSPFKGEFDQSIMYSIVNDQVEPLSKLVPDLPENLETIIIKTLEKDPDKRYQKISDVLADLSQIRDSLKESGTLTARSFKGLPIGRKSFIFGVALALLITILIVSSTYVLKPLLFKESDIERKKLVVLPFENLGAEGYAYFSEGITEEITSSLASLHNLGVISRQSAMHYADTRYTTEQIGKELAVDYILTGTVRWAPVAGGDPRLRITSHLVQVKDDIEIWTQTYQHVLQDIFQTQCDIATQVVNALGMTLNEPYREIFAQKPTENLEAYQAFLRARWFTNRPHFSAEDWENAIQNYKNAVTLDTTFALAYAELAKAHARMYYLRQDVSEIRLRKADDAAHKAARLNPESAEVRLALGYYYLWAYRDRKTALEEWALAEKQMPNNVDILVTKTYVYEPQGRWEEGIEVVKRAFELDPKNADLPTHLVLFYWMLRQYEQALDYCDQAIVLEPDAVWPYLYKTFIHWSWKGADDISRASLSAAPMDSGYEWYLWSWYFQEVGEMHFQDALDLIERTPGEWLKHKMWAMPKDMLAGFIYNYLGEKEKARLCFERSIPLLRQACEAYPDDPRYHSSLGVALAGIGSKAEAIIEGKRAVELLPLSKDAAYGIPYAIDLVITYAMVGETDASLEQMEILLKNPSWITPEWIKIDIRNAPLYGQQKFELLMKKYGKHDP